MRAFLKSAVAAAAVTFASVAAASAATVGFDVDTGGFFTETLTVASAGAVLGFEADTGFGLFAIAGAGLSDFGLFAAGAIETFVLAAGNYTVLIAGFADDTVGALTLGGPASFGSTPVVPLPAGLPLLLGALGVAGLMARRRKAA